MAENDEDLVSQIKIEGTQQSSDDLNKMADDGVSAFDRLGDAARKAGALIASGSKTISNALGSIEPPSALTAERLGEIAQGMGELKIAATSSISAVAGFAAGVAAIGAVVVGAVAGVAKFAASTTRAYRELNDSTSDNVRLTQAQGKASVQSANQSNQYGESLRKLREQLRLGKITYSEYGLAIRSLNEDFARQAASVRRVQAAQEEAQKKNDLAQRAEQDRVALKKLVDMYGGPLTTSLIALGTTYDQIKKQAVDAFSPALSNLIDSIGAIIDRNRTAITKFIDDTSTALADFIKNNGPAIEKFFSIIMDIIKGVGTTLTLIVIPRLVHLMEILDAIAVKINQVFGTEFTGGTLLAAAAILKLTGGFSTLKTLIQATIVALSALATIFSVSIVTVGLVVVAIGLLFAAIMLIDWTAFGERAVSAGTRILTFFQTMPAKVGAFFSALWESVKTMTSEAVQWVITKWTEFVTWIAAIPDRVSQIFTDLWNRIKQSATEAFDSLKTTIKGWVDSVLGWLKPILDMMAKINAQSESSPGSESVGAFAGGGAVRGPGTATSDSIPAWLSNNEWVMRAKAVRKYGSGFMRAVNEGRFKMPKFSMGGLNMISPTSRIRYAEGGPVGGSSMQPLNLSLFGEEFKGLMMPEDVAGRMTKFAIARQSRSAGRKPAWVGGNR